MNAAIKKFEDKKIVEFVSHCEDYIRETFQNWCSENSDTKNVADLQGDSMCYVF